MTALDDKRRRAHRAGYFGNLAFVDTCIGHVYKTLEKEKPNSKVRFSRYIKYLYLETLTNSMEKSKYRVNNKMEFIRRNSDYMMDQINLKLRKNVLISKDIKDISIEDLEFGLTIVLCKAFIDCKILENPQK